MTFATRNVGAARAGVAIFILFLVGIALASMFMVVVPKDNKDAVLMLIGGLNTAMGMVCGYYFNVGTKGRAGQ